MATPRCKCWLKIEPVFKQWGDREQNGWKVVGVAQKQPKSGYSVCLDLAISVMPTVNVDVEPSDIHIMTETDNKVKQVVEGLDSGGAEPWQ